MLGMSFRMSFLITRRNKAPGPRRCRFSSWHSDTHHQCHSLIHLDSQLKCYLVNDGLYHFILLFATRRRCPCSSKSPNPHPKHHQMSSRTVYFAINSKEQTSTECKLLIFMTESEEDCCANCKRCSAS